MASTNSYVCDTLPAPRLASAATDSEHITMQQASLTRGDDVHQVHEAAEKDPGSDAETDGEQPPPARKLCVRHQRMADEGTNLKLQQSLDALPFEERSAVSTIWSSFSASSHPRRALILQGLLTMCCFSQLSLLTEQLAHLIRLDPFIVLPREVSLKILGHLDATSLCRAAQVSNRWRGLADDDVLWRGICEQHIGQKCRKCGWALPVLEKRRLRKEITNASPPPDSSMGKRKREDTSDNEGASKRPRGEDSPPLPLHPPLVHQVSACSLLVTPSTSQPATTTRPWKSVYSERMTVEQNWRRGRCFVRTLSGHTDGVMCLQFSDSLSHPAFPVLITGSYDRTARVWNLETGQELHCLKGHTRAVRALQFDDVKLVTGSMDSTLKVWDWRRGKLVRTLNGHANGVVCLNFDDCVLASGSVDATIKIWNLRTGGAFTLRGHSDWVNTVQLWDTQGTGGQNKQEMFDQPDCGQGGVGPGKMLFSGSDDGTIRLWDLTARSCVRIFTGHVAQVQSMKLLLDDDERCEPSTSKAETALDMEETVGDNDKLAARRERRKPILISGSLDNTIKEWDIETGQTTRTYFGHIEGVWGVASDKMRLVSASHDRTLKVWSREDGRCIATLVQHTAAVSCLAIGEDRIVSGGDDNMIKVWSFGPQDE